jgi:hypothetical protein
MNRGLPQLLVLRTAVFSCILFATAPFGLLAQTATIHVRVLDGRSGKNLSGMALTFVDYHAGQVGGADGDLNGRTLVKTSVDGDLYIANPNVHGVLVFDVLDRAVWWTRCSRQRFYNRDTRAYGSEYLYPVSTIVASGLATSNNCSKKTAMAKPGELIIFVRPVTWWEKFIYAFRS